MLLPHHPHHIQVDAMCDIVHLGINSANQDAACAAAGLLKAQLLSTTGGASLLPDQALDLLGTAVEQSQIAHPLSPGLPPRFAMFSIVASLRDSNSLDAVSPAQLMPILQHTVQLDAVDLHSGAVPPEGRKRVTRIVMLMQQPAAEQLAPQQLAALLEVAVAANDQLNFMALKFQHAPHHGFVTAPAYLQLDAATVVALMMLTVKAAAPPWRTESRHCILQHLLLGGAGLRLMEGDCQLLLPVLLAAISVWPDETCSSGSVFKTVTSLAEGQISSTVLLELLTAALQAGKQQAFVDLWKSSGWQARYDLNAAGVGQLLRSASRCSKHMFIAIKKLLRKHAAWRDVRAEASKAFWLRG
jgi:hypothetical protein